MITHVNHAGANPVADTLLCLVEDGMHHTRRLGRSLDTVEALACVTEAVRNVLRQQILLCQRPQMEHVYTLSTINVSPRGVNDPLRTMQNLLPQRETLQNICILLRMIMTQPSPILPTADRQTALGVLCLGWMEMHHQ